MSLTFQLFSLSAAMLVIFLAGCFKYHAATDRSRAKLVVAKIGFALLAWCVYVYIIVRTNVLANFNIPFFPILLLLPLIIICILIFRSVKRSPNVKHVNLFDLTIFQSFRIFVELILFQIAAIHIIPESASFAGYNFDIIMGITAIAMAFLYKFGKISNQILQIWNIIGILMIGFVVFIIGSSIYFPQVWGSDIPLVDLSFLRYPYILVASFLAPIAIVVHVISLTALSGPKN